MSATNDLHTVRIVFHSASQLPVADLLHASCDPFLQTSFIVPTLSKQDQPGLVWRTPTIHNTRDPTWDCHWIVSGVSSPGFRLKIRAYDEDTNDRDDRLGQAVLVVGAKEMKEGVKERTIKLEKRRGHIRPWLKTYLSAMLPGEKLAQHSSIVVSMEVLGKCRDSERQGPYTVGPNAYSQHFSPLIGSVVNRNKPNTDDESADASDSSPKSDKPKLSASSFVANKLQLTGPAPPSLRFHYVGYHFFIDWLFRSSGITGRLLHRGLMRQYHTIYSYGKETKYGVVNDSNVTSSSSDKTSDLNVSLAKHFLTLTKHGRDNAMYTYVITLDSQWRFTETGDEFAVDFLSKHMMHSGCAKEVVFAGEFYVRWVGDGNRDGTKAEERDGDESELDTDPSHYELIIDNDSGTYRPPVSHLPTLQSWLAAPERLGALSRVIAVDAFDDDHQTNKKKRKEAAKKAKEKKGKGKMWGVRRKGSSVSSLSARGDETSLSSEEVEGVLRGGDGEVGVGAKLEKGKKEVVKEVVGLVKGKGKEKQETKQDEGITNGEAVVQQ